MTTTNFVLVPLILVGTCALFFYIGLHIHDLNKKLDDLLEKANKQEPQPVITMGQYAPKVPIADSDSPTGLVTAKSPQLVEWEEQEAVRKMNLGPQ